MRVIWGLGVWLVPSLSMAACPMIGDLDMGIEIAFKDGHRSIYSRDAAGVLREQELQDDGSSFNYLTANGVLETGYFEMAEADGDPQGWETYSYTFEQADNLPLKPWSGQSGYQIAYAPDGAETNRTLFGYRTRDATDVQIGDCRYDALPLETYYGAGGDGFRSINFLFLPELGIPVTISFADSGGSETWEPVAIGVVDAKTVAFTAATAIQPEPTSEPIKNKWE